jgi:uncharacterized protein YfdQ (DUF2303 family)
MAPERDFVSILGDLSDGDVSLRLTEALRSCVNGARRAEKDAKLTLTLTISPDDRLFVVTAKIKADIPTPGTSMTALYTCPLSEQWKFWTANNGKKFKQDDFAQLIEDRMDDLASPTGAGGNQDLPSPSEVLTMARQLVVRSKGEFSRSFDPTTGNSSLTCKTENDTGSTKIPRAFLLQLPVFEAGAVYAVEARIRFELAGAPTFSYLLYRAEEIKRDAFDEVRTIVEQRTELPLFAGAPEQ